LSPSRKATPSRRSRTLPISTRKPSRAMSGSGRGQQVPG
jgi:hypothetical protein